MESHSASSFAPFLTPSDNSLAANSWALNCAVQPTTNGIDFNANTNGLPSPSPTIPGQRRGRFAKGNIITTDSKPANAINLPPQFTPTVPLAAGGEGVIQSYILPDNKTGVVSPFRFLLPILPYFSYPRLQIFV